MREVIQCLKITTKFPQRAGKLHSFLLLKRRVPCSALAWVREVHLRKLTKLTSHLYSGLVGDEARGTSFFQWVNQTEEDVYFPKAIQQVNKLLTLATQLWPYGLFDVAQGSLTEFHGLPHPLTLDEGQGNNNHSPS